MTALGLLVILFVIVPGFIADTLFRTTRGMAKGGEFERILRSLVWSVFGLGFYQLYLPEAPPYLSLIGKDADLVLAHLSILPLALHCMFACAAALVASGVAEDRVVRKAFTRFFSRSLGERPPWDVLWREHKDDRAIRIERKDGKVYWGKHYISSTGTGKRELVLVDPHEDVEGANPKPIDTVRFMYLPEDQIAEIRLSKTRGELQ